MGTKAEARPRTCADLCAKCERHDTCAMVQPPNVVVVECPSFIRVKKAKKEIAA